MKTSNGDTVTLTRGGQQEFALTVQKKGEDAVVVPLTVLELIPILMDFQKVMKV